MRWRVVMVAAAAWIGVMGSQPESGAATGCIFIFGSEADTDGDGLGDRCEQTVYHTSPFSVDSDGDGIGDGREVARGTDPCDARSASTLIHWDPLAGNDRWDGLGRSWDGRHGPKETWEAALAAALEGDTLTIIGMSVRLGGVSMIGPRGLVIRPEGTLTIRP